MPFIEAIKELLSFSHKEGQRKKTFSCIFHSQYGRICACLNSWVFSEVSMDQQSCISAFVV